MSPGRLRSWAGAGILFLVGMGLEVGGFQNEIVSIACFALAALWLLYLVVTSSAIRRRLPRPALVWPGQVVLLRGDIEAKDRELAAVQSALAEAESQTQIVLDDAHGRVEADRQLLARRDADLQVLRHQVEVRKAEVTDLRSRLASTERNVGIRLETESKLRTDLQQLADQLAQAAITFDAREQQLLGEIEDIRGLQERYADELRALQQLREPKLAIVYEVGPTTPYAETQTLADEGIFVTHFRLAVENLSDGPVKGIQVLLATCGPEDSPLGPGRPLRLASDEPPYQRSRGFTLGPKARELINVVDYEGLVTDPHGVPLVRTARPVRGLEVCYASASSSDSRFDGGMPTTLAVRIKSDNAPEVEARFQLHLRPAKGAQAPYYVRRLED